MFNKKKAKAKIIEIISCNRRESVFRDYYAEDLADRYSSYRYPGERWSARYDFMELHREYVWFEIKLKIKYTVSSVTYEKEIDIQSQTSTIKDVMVYYEKKNPERIVDIAYR